MERYVFPANSQVHYLRVQVGLLVFSFFAKVTGHLILSVL